MNTPTAIQILNATKIQHEGQSLLIKPLDGMKNLVAIGTAKLVKFFVQYPATELNDKCKMVQVYQAKRCWLTSRHVEFAIEYAESDRVQSKYMRNL